MTRRMGAAFVAAFVAARWDAKLSHKPLPGETQPPKVTLAPATAPDGTGVGLGVTVRF